MSSHSLASSLLLPSRLIVVKRARLCRFPAFMLAKPVAQLPMRRLAGNCIRSAILDAFTPHAIDCHSIVFPITAGPLIGALVAAVFKIGDALLERRELFLQQIGKCQAHPCAFAFGNHFFIFPFSNAAMRSSSATKWPNISK